MRLRFILGEIGHGLRRNLSMTISVILVTFVSLTFVGSAGLLQMQINEMKGEWYDRIEVSIFLCPSDSEKPTCAGGEASPDQIAAVEAALESEALAPYVERVYFESKEEAFASFQARYADELWAQSVTADQMRKRVVELDSGQMVRDQSRGVYGSDR